MKHVISATLIPTNGINVKLSKDLFLENFIDTSEDILDRFPVGSAVEIIYDHFFYDDKGALQMKHCRCIIKQSKRGVFNRSIENVQVEKNIRSCLYTYNQKRKFLKNKLS